MLSSCVVFKPEEEAYPEADLLERDFVPRAYLKMLAAAGGPLSPQLVRQGRG